MGSQMAADRWCCQTTFSIVKCFTISSIIYLTIIVVSFVVLEIMFAMDPNFFLDVSKYPTAKSSSLFQTLPGTNMTKADLVHSTHDNFVSSFVIWGFILYAATFLLASALYVSREKVFEHSLKKNSLLSQSAKKRLRKARNAFLGKTYSRLRSPQSVSIHQYGLHSVATDKILPPNSYEVRANLEDFMFSKAVQGKYHLHVDVILWLHDLMKTVDSMHSKKLYHLNLQPQTVFVHWLQGSRFDKYNSIIEDYQPNTLRQWILHTLKNALRKNGKDPEVRIVLGDLSHAVLSEDGKVYSRSVAVPEYYKPPECRGDGHEVDASKVDAWGIGVIASEILTGGFIKILSQSTSAAVAQPSFDKKHFNNALFAMYDLKRSILQQRFFGIEFQKYDMDHTKFAIDCFEFVGGLLEADPHKRMDLKQALELPLMSKVRQQLGDLYYFNYSF